MSSTENKEEWVSMFRADAKIVPRSVWGRFAKSRWVMVWFTQLIFYGTAWLQMHDRQLLLFDVEHRRFFIGPLVFYPQDFIFLTALLVISALSLFLFTAVAGRVWCGYACPQTVYTEIFMWIERKIEGDRAARLRLAAGPWNLQRIVRTGGKHLAWLAVAGWTGFTFVGYFTPIRELMAEISQFTLGPWELFWVGLYSLATYGNAGWMREQVCKYMCPYARFQSAMFDRDTLLVTYDEARGEPRGPRGKNADPAQLQLGACVDCGLCVQVCPTGIDIRKGLQYECIGCAACVDVCDNVMDKMGYDRGLVKYSTQNGMLQKLDKHAIFARMLRPRVLIYSTILWMLIGAFFMSLNLRHDLRVDVVRDRTLQYRLVENGEIENVYRFNLMNASEYPLQVSATANSTVTPSASTRLVETSPWMLNPTESRWVVVHVRANPDDMQAGSNPLAIQLESRRIQAGEPDEGSLQKATENTVFLAPQ